MQRHFSRTLTGRHDSQRPQESAWGENNQAVVHILAGSTMDQPP